MPYLQLLLRLFLGIAMLVSVAAAIANDGNKAYLVEIDGSIGPVTQELIVRGIDNAEVDRATMVILQMDTPGGLDHSMREIIKAILDAHVPVITYISPRYRLGDCRKYRLIHRSLARKAKSTMIKAVWNEKSSTTPPPI
jgi:membrane-bound serine protease (ClpP class)